MSTIFSKIVAGEIPAYKVAENEQYLAFLDINPLTEGHTLVIPKTEVDYLFDMDSANYNGLCEFARKVAIGIKQVIPCKRIGVAVIGLEVPHAHIHLVPLHDMNDLNFSKPKLKLSQERLVELTELIKKSIVL